MRLSLLVATLLFTAAPAAARDAPSALDQISETRGLDGSDAVLGTTPLETPAGADLVPPGCGTPGNPPCPPVDAPQVPVDGGLGLLAVAGAGYAARRLHARRAA